MTKPICIICRKPQRSGIMISGRGICNCCEERLMNLRVESDFYEHYKECIKKTMVQSIIRGEDRRCQSYHL